MPPTEDPADEFVIAHANTWQITLIFLQLSEEIPHRLVKLCIPGRVVISFRSPSTTTSTQVLNPLLII